jgi:hypothetical protein
MSDANESNRANSMPINRAALKRLKQAKAELMRGMPPLIQLGLWGLETLELSFPKTGASKQDVEDFLLKLARDSNPARVTKLLAGDNGEERVLSPQMLTQDDPEDAALLVVNQALLLLNTA